MVTPAFFILGGRPRLYATELATRASSGVSPRVELEYLNEGGANFVFRILPTGEDQLPAFLKGKLLRLRKDLPTVPSAEDQLQALDANFRDLFPAENVVQHELIALDEVLPTLLNEALRNMNRPGHRAADFLPAEKMYGLLVTDMTPEAGDNLLQLKPKWLTQSPSAPLGAKRCRTCAMRAQRASLAIRTATDAQESCPLDLINPRIEERKRAVYAVTNDKRLREYLIYPAQPLLTKIQQSQMMFDPNGMLKTSTSEGIQMLCKAMTLRDCTLFLKRSGSTIEARLGDLDLKQPEKLARWKKVESSLINDGWYTNTEHDDNRKPETVCMLSRE